LILFSVGRIGATDALNLAFAGLAADDRGRIAVDERYLTNVPHIYAVGNVVRFPSLASTSMEQGRLLAVHAIGTGATELIHIGQAVAKLSGTLDYFLQSVFNYPTLAECYKVAALDCANNLG